MSFISHHIIFYSYFLNHLSLQCFSMTPSETFLIMFGNIFQEYNHFKVPALISKRYAALQFIWVLATTLMTMAFVGNLKSTLVKKSYESKTRTLIEMIDKDMTVNIPLMTAQYLEVDPIELNKRILCQAKKTNGVYNIG